MCGLRSQGERSHGHRAAPPPPRALADGRPTAEENLVTLCGTCHKGLDPDFEPALRELAGLPGPAAGLDMDNAEFDEEVTRCRALAGEVLAQRQVP
ncbi:hypothetical protein [Streptomyces goshikiensis]